MINMLTAIGELTRGLVELGLRSLGMFLVAAVGLSVLVGVPVLAFGIVWKALCVIFSLEFSWLIPLALVCLAWYLIITAEGED